MAQLASASRGITGTQGYEPPEVSAVVDLRHTDRAAYERRRQEAGIMTPKADVYQLGLVIHLMAIGKLFSIGRDPKTIQLPERYRGVTGLVPELVWCLQVDPRDRLECTASMEDGFLYAVEMFRRQRDRMRALGTALGEEVWNVSGLEDERAPLRTVSESESKERIGLVS